MSAIPTRWEAKRRLSVFFNSWKLWTKIIFYVLLPIILLSSFYPTPLDKPSADTINGKSISLSELSTASKFQSSLFAPEKFIQKFAGIQDLAIYDLCFWEKGDAMVEKNGENSSLYMNWSVTVDNTSISVPPHGTACFHISSTEVRHYTTNYTWAATPQLLFSASEFQQERHTLIHPGTVGSYLTIDLFAYVLIVLSVIAVWVFMWRKIFSFLNFLQSKKWF